MATTASSEDDTTTAAQDAPTTSSSNENGVSSTTESGVTQPAGGSQETTASSGEEVDNTPIRETPMSISFDQNFDDFLAKFSTAEEARSKACNETMNKLELTEATFKNCDIGSGSVVISFVLVQSEKSGNATVDALRTQVHGSSLVLEISGTSYTVDRESLVVNNEPQKPAPAEEESDSTVVIIVVVVVLLIIIIVVVVAFFVVKNKQNQNNKVFASVLLCLSPLESKQSYHFYL